jgi:hypothetical protein
MAVLASALSLALALTPAGCALGGGGEPGGDGPAGAGSTGAPDSAVDAGDLYGQNSAAPAPGDGEAGAGTAGGEGTAGGGGAVQMPALPTDGPDAKVPWGPNGEVAPNIVQQFGLTDDQRDAVERAEDSLMVECMTEQGFESWPADPEPVSAQLADWDENIGLYRPESARTFGYHAPDPAADFDPWASHGGPPPDWQKPEYEKAQEDCSGAANRKIYGGNSRDTLAKPVYGIRHSAVAEAAQNSKVRKAIKKWSACMAAAGYSYESPNEPSGGFYRRWEGSAEEGPEEKELLTAAADLGCKAKTGLVGIYRVQVWKAQNAAIKANRPLLEQFQEQEQAVLARAQKVIGKGAG